MMTSPGHSATAASFDPAAMARLLDGEHAAIRQQVRAILSRPSFRYPDPTADIPTQRELAFRWCRELADEGIGLLAVPAEYGGQDDFGAFMAAFETIAFHDLGMTIKFTVQFGIWLGSVLLLGNAAQHRRYLRDIGTFALPGCFAMTEIGHGSNVRELETLARYEPASGQFVVTSPTWAAGKNYIGNGACHGRLATVFAQLETAGERHGVHAFLVPLRDEKGNILPGVRIEDNGPKMGENGVDNARIWFDGLRVDRDALLDRYGSVAADGTYRSDIRSAGARFFTTISALVGGRISIAAAALSAGKSGLTIAVRYAVRRRQFRAAGASDETPLLDYPTHQRRLLPLLANAYALDFAHKFLVRRRLETQAADADPAGKREVELLAAGIKAWTTWNTTRTLQTCRECCGGEGYMSVNRLPALKADSDIFTTFEGDNTVLMLWIGRQLLAEADRTGGSVQTAPTDTGSEYLPLFAVRAQGMLDEIRADLARLTAGSTDAPRAAAQQQMKLPRLAHAWVERIILEQFGTAIACCEDRGCADAFARLYDLFALTLLEENRAWFLENDLLSAEASKALPRAVEEQCARLAPDALALVDAFGIPDQCLAAPIAL